MTDRPYTDEDLRAEAARQPTVIDQFERQHPEAMAKARAEVRAAARRQRYAAAFGPTMRIGLQETDLDAERIEDWITWITNAVMAVADRELTQVREELEDANGEIAEMQRDIASLRKQAAEVRAAAHTAAAADLEAHCHRHGDGEATFADCLCAAAHELRRMAAAARPDDTTTPAVGDRYDCRYGGEGVTVTRVWTLDNGHPAVDFAWHDDKPGDDGSALPLASFHRSYQPARPDDTTGA